MQVLPHAVTHPHAQATINAGAYKLVYGCASGNDPNLCFQFGIGGDDQIGLGNYDHGDVGFVEISTTGIAPKKTAGVTWARRPDDGSYELTWTGGDQMQRQRARTFSTSHTRHRTYHTHMHPRPRVRKTTCTCTHTRTHTRTQAKARSARARERTYTPPTSNPERGEYHDASTAGDRGQVYGSPQPHKPDKIHLFRRFRDKIQTLGILL